MRNAGCGEPADGVYMYLYIVHSEHDDRNLAFYDSKIPSVTRVEVQHHHTVKSYPASILLRRERAADCETHPSPTPDLTTSAQFAMSSRETQWFAPDRALPIPQLTGTSVFRMRRTTPHQRCLRCSSTHGTSARVIFVAGVACGCTAEDRSALGGGVVVRGLE